MECGGSPLPIEHEIREKVREIHGVPRRVGRHSTPSLWRLVSIEEGCSPQHESLMEKELKKALHKCLRWCKFPPCSSAVPGATSTTMVCTNNSSRIFSSSSLKASFPKWPPNLLHRFRTRKLPHAGTLPGVGRATSPLGCGGSCSGQRQGGRRVPHRVHRGPGQAPPSILARVFRYFALLHIKYGTVVIPIVVYGDNSRQPLSERWTHYGLEFAGHRFSISDSWPCIPQVCRCGST